MYLLINELSFNGQASNRYAARSLMRALMDLTVSFRKLPRAKDVFSHSTFYSLHLMPNFSVLECLRTLKQDDVARLFFLLATGGKYIDRILVDKAPALLCHHNGADVSRSCLAGAVYVDGSVASLGEMIGFEGPTISVRFAHDGVNWQDGDLKNFVDADVLRSALRKRYTPSAKHAPGGWGTLMDLDFETAEYCLNCGLQSSNGQQVYGCHDGRLYEFQPDGTGSFHGYPVPGREVPIDVLRNMRDNNTISQTEYRRLIGEGPAQ